MILAITNCTHDYVFDENGNMLILATDTTQDSVGDIVLKLDVNSGEVTEVLDLGDLFGEYKKTCVKILPMNWTGCISTRFSI